MKRNRFGVNLDEGLPLVSPEEFDLLYVPCFEPGEQKLSSWLQQAKTPLLFGGQIGSGKSTLIRKSFLETGVLPDVVLQFDQEGLNCDTGDFWAILLEGIVRFALNRGMDLSFSRFPAEMADLLKDDWVGLLGILAPEDFSLETFTAKKNLRRLVGENFEYVRDTVRQMIQLQQKSAPPLLVFASGIDKFASESPAFFMLKDVLQELLSVKTLFEVNSTHLFNLTRDAWEKVNRYVLPAAAIHDCKEMLLRRMGVYSPAIDNELSILAHWSGGNPRQALRLLTHFETARKWADKSMPEKLAWAFRQTTGDFFAYSQKPSDSLMAVVRKDGKLEGTMVSLPGDKETARRALYGNWLLVAGQAEGTCWPAIVNPLAKSFFLNKLMPKEPEMQLLLEYAQAQDMSPDGIGIEKIHTEGGEEKSGDTLLYELLSSGVEQPIPMNLAEILDVMGAALLSVDRADRVIIAYRDEKILDAARAYLFAKANTYEYQRCLSIQIGKDASALEQLQGVLNEDFDILSVEFSPDLSDEQLNALDKYRDRLISYQMIWWLPYESLGRYLSRWTQLRQLFEVFVLEDELLNSLTLEEIQSDLAFFEDLVEKEESAEANLVHYLKIVLGYLVKSKGAEIE